MKITDIRDGTTMAGELVTTFPANQAISKADMKRYFKIQPESATYDVLSRPWPQDRLVLRRGDSEDKDFYIVPAYEFYHQEP